MHHADVETSVHFNQWSLLTCTNESMPSQLLVINNKNMVVEIERSWAVLWMTSWHHMCIALWITTWPWVAVALSCYIDQPLSNAFSLMLKSISQPRPVFAQQILIQIFVARTRNMRANVWDGRQTIKCWTNANKFSPIMQCERLKREIN